MILAPLSNPALRASVLRAALPEEDVFFRVEDVKEALRLGFPRLLVRDREDPFTSRVPGGEGPERDEPGLPVLELTPAVLHRWRGAWQARGLAVTRIDDSALRLRALMHEAAGGRVWVDRALADLTRIAGGPLPPEFRGFARRVMEFPARYTFLQRVGESVDLSPGALKARFRRRGLPSPARYLSWLRLLAVDKVLANPSRTILTASQRLGFASDGNFCRWVRSASGLSPTQLRRQRHTLWLQTRFAGECLQATHRAGWRSLDGLFLRSVA